MPKKTFLNEKQEIEKQIKQLKRKIRTLHSRQRRPVITSIIRSMIEYEITPEEIAQAYEKRSTIGTKSTAPARFKHPSTGDTWSGRGRPPRWIVEAETQGQHRDQFLIKE